MDWRKIIFCISMVLLASLSAFFFVIGADTRIKAAAVAAGDAGLDNRLKLVPPPPEVETYALSGTSSTLRLTSAGFLAGDVESGNIFYEKNSHKTFPIASVTKLMTALVSLDNLDQTAVATVTKRAVSTYGQEGGLIEGERIRVGDLLYPLFFESSNDAAEVLAEFAGRDRFLALMNEKARSLNMADTHYEDPTGLTSANVSTAADLFTFARYLYTERKEVLKLASLKRFTVAPGDHVRSHTWINRNKFVRENYDGYLGGKTGYIPEASQTFLGLFSLPLVKSAEATTTDKKVAIAILKSDSRDKDSRALINYIERGVSFTKEPSRKLSVMLVGDIMMDRGVKTKVERDLKGDYSLIFKNADFLKRANIAFGNLEGPVSDKGYDLGNLYSFRMSPSVIDVLKDAGFAALSVANNHIGDWGRNAFEDTLTRLDKAGVAAVGGGYYYDDAKKVKILKSNGLSVGFVGFSDVGPEWLTENNNLPVILSANDPNIKTIIENAAKSVDVLVVSFHFGDEYQTESNDRQKSLARLAIDVGAKVVVGHHPHVIQEVEKYKEGLIAYSLGNFVFDQNFNRETMQGRVLEVIFDGTKIDDVNEGLVQLNDEYQPKLIEDYDL